MFASVFGCPASLAFVCDLERQPALIAIVDIALFHVSAMDHSNLLRSILALDYIQQGSIIK
jgi:hypothetical protein